MTPNDLLLRASYDKVQAPDSRGGIERCACAPQVRRMAARLPNGRFYTVAGATHAMPLTHRDELQAVIRAFLAELRDDVHINHNH